MTKSLRYNIIFRQEPEGGFTVIVPSLPGCITYGKTIDEAREMAQDAVRAYIVSLRKHQETIPTDEGNSLFSSIEIRQQQLIHV